MPRLPQYPEVSSFTHSECVEALKRSREKKNQLSLAHREETKFIDALLRRIGDLAITASQGPRLFDACQDNPGPSETHDPPPPAAAKTIPDRDPPPPGRKPRPDQAAAVA